jgi:hypothetical protein
MVKARELRFSHMKRGPYGASFLTREFSKKCFGNGFSRRSLENHDILLKTAI